LSPDVWELRDFLTRYDEWIGRDTPADDQRVLVISWIHFLQSDPYRGATRRLDLGFDFWFAEVPDAGDDQEGVFALYRINEGERSATCDVIATLRKPVVP